MLLLLTLHIAYQSLSLIKTALVYTNPSLGYSDVDTDLHSW
jgi:hypothetical protein